MNSIVNNNLDTLKRRLILAIGILVGISTMVLATPTLEEAGMSEVEAKTLILNIKEDLKLDEYVAPELEFDDEGNITSSPVQMIKVYDQNNELLLEAPITKLEQYENKHLQRLINASDFLIENHNTKYYRLDLK